jgi:branched-subunit amino acid aminotransferase/4-amino-4-deoxychorismate lyase
MLDDQGYAASCDASNFFLVRGKEVLTSTDDACFNGVTRAAVMRLRGKQGIRAGMPGPVTERLAKLYQAMVERETGGHRRGSSFGDGGFMVGRLISTYFIDLSRMPISCASISR